MQLSQLSLQHLHDADRLLLRVQSGATLLPEAQAMLPRSAKTAALQGADFSTPFDAQSTAQSLGAESLLPMKVELAADARQLR
jgi:hypothetical protein